MKAKKLICLAFPLMLVAGVGCSKDNTEEKKTETVSKTKMKVVLSEKQYPYYICEQMVEFQFKKDEFVANVLQASKDKDKVKDVLKSVDEIEEILDAIENIEVPSKYKDKQKVMLEGVSEARKGLESIKDSSKKDKTNIQESVTKTVGNLSTADIELWEPIVKEISKENPDAYEKALDNKMEQHKK
ncbi:hypothetical protein CN326_22260 [Bacillus sp. AFS018417]|uniref:DUF7018 domain-containing protein n=1 Tax=Bacillus rhizoplanae TaxID=2880966 RepID=A0ABM8YGS5_9BACI|nr:MULTISPECIES: hypothetical protein [Bacillus]PEZ00736.1 hypothetical protein CN326_22260 [Bacillus sp. AFS018417]CAG9614944.1 hypothetical protein BACCIP111899_04178 [Bacillus rhizoplanae]